MADINNPLIPALRPLTKRVRRDVTAVKRADGVQAWTQEPLTVENLARHLNGGPARGVCPIKAGESVTLVALLDFDSHGGETSWEQMSCIAAGVFDILSLAYGCEPLAFRSSGGRGIHLYLMWDEPQDAHSVRQWLGQVLGICGLRNGVGGVAAGCVEVFPKQDSVPADGYGNQFIMPLSGKSELLEFEDLSVSLIPADRALSANDWRASPTVPTVVKQPRAICAASDTPAVWRDALTSITAGQSKRPLTYDQWRDVVFAIHYETDGQGLALAHEMSAASTKYDEAFLDNRVWPYVRDRTDGAQVTGRTLMAIARDVYGWVETLDVEAFPVVADVAPAVPPKPEKRVPAAKHLCTDLRNAQRLEQRYGGQLFSVAGRWMAWDGRRWIEDDADVYRIGCKLSEIVDAEAKIVEEEVRQVLPDLNLRASKLKVPKDAGDAAEALVEKLGALRGWSKKSEMRPTVEAAIGFLKKMRTAEADSFDADPLKINVRNGILDLTTGVLAPHAPGARMSHLIDIDYDPDATCPEWEAALQQITLEETGPAPLADFLRRWSGYCLTGSTKHQVFVVHHGDGSNGKSLLIELLSKTAGGYACSAPTGLLSATKYDSVKDTELAALRGRRAVTAHETRDGCELREDLVKMTTGTDRISARQLYGDPFNFEPTHKMQLLTNHKPVIRGQDHGIWRRVVLVPYRATFGSDADVAAGKATHLKDEDLLEKLSTPEALKGILAWRVRGAVECLKNGLGIPEAVTKASGTYRAEMDRVGQFIDQCCELGAGFAEPMSVGVGGGLYPAYSGWCREAGYHPVGRNKFAADLAKHIDGWDGETVQRYEVGDTGKRRKVTLIPGIRLLHE